jgi:hypothetical protein
MPCAKPACQAAGLDDFGDFCGSCGGRIAGDATAQLGEASLVWGGPSPGVTTLICAGHGTYHSDDGRFLIPNRMQIFFGSSHGVSVWGAKLQVTYLASETLHAGQECYNYRLWHLWGPENLDIRGVKYRGLEPLDINTSGNQLGVTGRSFGPGGISSQQGHLLYLSADDRRRSITLRDICTAAAHALPGRTVHIYWEACREVLRAYQLRFPQ